MGSLVCLHKSSPLPRLAEVKVNALDMVLFGGALHRVEVLLKTIHKNEKRRGVDLRKYTPKMINGVIH